MNTVVITGLLRNMPEFYSALNHVTELRELGHVDRIILSTWHGEIKPDLERILSHAQIDIIESNPPSQALLPKPFWNSSAQAISLLRALEQVDDSECILKVRTDKSTPLINRYIPFLKRGLIDSENSGLADNQPLQKKLVVRLIRASVPFHINDFTVMGLCSDLKKICRSQFILESRAPTNGLGVENRWLLGPFFDHSVLIRSFFECFRGFDLMLALSAWADDEKTELPDIIHSLFFVYFSYLYSSFENLDEPETRLPGPPNGFRDYFNTEDSEYARSIGTSRGIVRNIKSLGNIKDFVNTLERPEPDTNKRPIAEKDFLEISEFIQKYNPRSSAQGAKPQSIRLSTKPHVPGTVKPIDLNHEILDSLRACGLDEKFIQKITPILGRKEVSASPVKAFGLAARALKEDPKFSRSALCELLINGAKLREPLAQRLLVDLQAKNKTTQVDTHLIDLAKQDIARREAAKK